MRKVRRLRHWKQRFDKNSKFIWRKNTTWLGKQVKPGDPIPEQLEQAPAKLRRFWEAGVIELAEFDEPNVLSGQVEKSAASSPEDLVSKEADRKWRVEGLGATFPSKAKALEAAAKLLAKAEEDGVTEKHMLVGTDLFDAVLDINGEEVQLGEVVALAFEGSDMSIDEWNDLDGDVRDALIEDTVGMMTDLGPELEDDDAPDAAESPENEGNGGKEDGDDDPLDS